MMIKLVSLLPAIAAIISTSSAAAQAIDERVMRQEARIDDSEAAGRLTKSQAQELMSAEKHLMEVESMMRWKYGGHLSQRQRHELEVLADQRRAAISRMTRTNSRTAGGE